MNRCGNVGGSPHRLTARFVQLAVRASPHRLTATTQTRHAKTGVADAGIS